MTARRAVVLALLCLAATLPALWGVFQFDDYNVIVNEPAVHSWAAFFGRLGGVRPLLRASYTLCWTWGVGELGFHLFNNAVHALNAVLVYAVGRALCARWSEGGQEGEGEGAVLGAALLFALHPVQTEAVAYISGRSTSLMASFYLGALYAYLRGCRPWITVLLMGEAAAVKETAVTLPAALLLCELCGPSRPDWKVLARRQASVWLLLPIGALVLWRHAGYRDLVSYGFTQRGLADNLLAQVNGVCYLLSRLIALRGFNIDPALAEPSAWSPALAAQAAFLAALAAGGLACLRRRPWVAFGVLWFFLQLAPTNSLVPRLDVANERQLYLACWGLFLALCVELERLRLPAAPARAAAAALLGCLAVASAARQLDYSSESRLWESSLRQAPLNPRALNNLGQAYEVEGRSRDAAAAYRAALGLQPDYLKARVNLRLLQWEPGGRSPAPPAS